MMIGLKYMLQFSRLLNSCLSLIFLLLLVDISIFQSILALFHEIDESSEFIDETLSELQQFSEQGEITERKNECLNILYNLYDIEFKQNQLELCKQIESQLLPFIKVWTVLKN